jgi:hypothetical protein
VKVLENTNIWSLWGTGWLCVPTNVGWKQDGSNVMGRGIALQAVKRFPELPKTYGRMCMAGHHDCVVYQCVSMPNNRFTLSYQDPRIPSTPDDFGLIMTPTKELKSETPHLSWKSSSSWERVDRTLKHLVGSVRPSLFGTFFVPLLGAGNGGLEQDEVLEYLTEELRDVNDVTIVIGSEPDDVSLQSDDESHDTVPVTVSRDDTNPNQEQEMRPVNTSLISDDFETVKPKQPKR